MGEMSEKLTQAKADLLAFEVKHDIALPMFDELAALFAGRQPAAPVQVTGEMVQRAIDTFGMQPSFDAMKRALEAALQAGVPSGWKLVPEVPTQQMVAAGIRGRDDACDADRMAALPQ